MTEDEFAPHEPETFLVNVPDTYTPSQNSSVYQVEEPSPTKKNNTVTFQQAKTAESISPSGRAPRKFKGAVSADRNTIGARAQRKDNQNSIDYLLNDNSSKATRIATKILFGETVKDTDGSPEVFSLAVRDLEHRRDIFLLKGAYDESVKTAEAAEIARKLQLGAAKRVAQEYEMADVKLRQGHVQTDLGIFNHVKKAKFNDLRAKTEKSIEAMKQRHQRELEEHEQKWNEPQMQRLFNRRSPELMNLRIQERKLIAAKRFDEARVAKKYADEREAAEYAQSRYRFENEYKASRELLLKKQADEIATFEAAAKTKKDVFKVKTQKEKRALQNRKRTLKLQEEVAGDADKLWKLKHRTDWDQFAQPVSRARIDFGEPEGVVLLPPLERQKSSRKQKRAN